MSTKDELEQQVIDLQSALEEKQGELTKAQNAMEQLSKAGPGMGGWVVETPSLEYSGITLGVHFVNGRAFIEDRKGAAAVARELEFDFGYKVDKVTAEEVSKMRSDAEDVAEGYSESLQELYSPPQIVGA